MPLIVIQRKEKGLTKGCLECEHFVELKDDEKKYPSTVAVVCNAPQSVFMECFEFMWLMVRGRIGGTRKKRAEVVKPMAYAKQPEFREVLKRLRAVRKH